jgi:speckle-type POZ protein
MGTLLLARGRHTCCQLEDSCIEYIASDPKVRATEEYQELKNSCSPLIIEIMERVAAHNPNGARKSSDGMKYRPPEKTWSTYNDALVHSVHEFRIPNFCAVQRSREVGQVIHSGTFNVGGYDWHVLVYPSGVKGEDDQGSISIFLKLLSQPPVHGIEVSGKFFFGNPSGKFTTEKKEWSFTHIYTKTALAYGYTKLMTVESAKSGYLANDGSLTICCSFAVTKQPYTSTTSTPVTRAMIVVPSSSIALYLEQLLVGGHGSDVQFLVEGSEICAHSLVIAARSPILYEAVAAAVSNKDGHIVRIDGMKATVFKAVIHFVYTDELPTLGSTVVDEDMLAAASRFGLERMKIICENFLAEYISKENAVDTFNVARRHRCSKLEDYCIDFILSVPSLAKGLIKTVSLD